MSVKKRNIILIAAFLLACAALASVFFLTRPEPPEPLEGGKTISITVTSMAGETSTYTVSTDAEYLWDALYPEHIDGKDSEHGKFVTTVDGEFADEAKGEYWCFTKSGEWVMTSCDTTPIADGENYEFFIYK